MKTGLLIYAVILGMLGVFCAASFVILHFLYWHMAIFAIIFALLSRSFFKHYKKEKLWER